MKKNPFSIVVMLLTLSIHSLAQLHYLFSATTRPYVPVEGGIASGKFNIFFVSSYEDLTYSYLKEISITFDIL